MCEYVRESLSDYLDSLLSAFTPECGLFLTGPGSNTQQRKLDELNGKLQAAERRAEQAERSAHLAESDAHHKDQELSETLSRIRLYESVS